MEADDGVRRRVAVEAVHHVSGNASFDCGSERCLIRADQRQALEPTGRRQGKEKPPVE